MGTLLEQALYRQDIESVAQLPLEWERLRNSTFLIAGAAGMVGSFLIDVLLSGRSELGIHVIALVRNQEKAWKRFASYKENSNFSVLVADLNEGVPAFEGKVDYVIHAASQTHPRAYATFPIQTLLTNILGTENLLECGLQHQMRRFLFLSSVEIYGENQGDTETFAEDYCGYLDCNTLRAGYPEGKRAGEALCQAYIHEKQADIVIPRLSRTYGPTMLPTDSKAISQFIQRGIAREDIVLKSKGTQLYSYSYVADAVSGMLYCLLYGQNGEAYNISDAASDLTLLELANIVAGLAGKKVRFELPDAIEQAGYSKATKAVLDSGKLQRLGWKAQFSMREGLKHTIEILRAIG